MRQRSSLVLAAAIIAVLAADIGVLAATVGYRGGAVSAVVSRSSVTGGATTSEGFVRIPEARLNIGVPDGQQAILIITFSGTSHCGDADETTSAYCETSILVDGQPIAAGTVRFDAATVTDGHFGYQTASFTVAAGPLAAGPHTVTVDYRVDEGEATFELRNWNLTVMRARAA